MASVTEYMKSLPSAIANATADFLANSDFVSRMIGMTNSYEGLTFFIQSLGREPVSLLGKDYLFIYDHMRRVYRQGTDNMSILFEDCPKFTFYKEPPTIYFADVDNDPLSLKSRWVPDMVFASSVDNNASTHYAESDDGDTNNRTVYVSDANQGVAHGAIVTSTWTHDSCDMVQKTNDLFRAGRYRTLIGRFHTNADDTKSLTDTIQTAVSRTYGMSHGRNLLKLNPSVENSYDNPYCRVWTYHYQYNNLAKAIRPFSDIETAQALEEAEYVGDNETVGFRTTDDETFGFKGGSTRLDEYGVLNYRTNMPRIAPTATITDYFEHKEDKKTTIKRCMFSIENLAWRTSLGKRYKDEFEPYGLSPEQKGPLGGRIMWFPPYNLSFSEDVSVNWNANQFIGRGENVYTYTNTERRGNLSFMLLIDHPSIIDYWTGRNMDRPTNAGQELRPLNTDGVDGTDNQEQTLLRFFAGCDILTAKPQQFKTRTYKKPAEVVLPEPPQPAPPEPEVAKPKRKVLHCVLYYPNNYSGVNDAPTNSSSVVNAVDYLMNGIGAQKYRDANDDAADIPTINNQNVTVSGNNGNVITTLGGYEVKNPISIADHNVATQTSDCTDKYSIIYSTYTNTTSSQRKAQFLTDEQGTPYTISYGDGQQYQLVKIVGSQAMSLASAKKCSNLTGASHLWYRRRWYYRIDDEYQNQKLSTPDSYLDTVCFGLNSTGYTRLQSHSDIMQAFGINDEESTTLVSFTDVYVGLSNDDTIANTIGAANYNESNVQLIREIATNTEKYKIESIAFEGHASYQGYSQLNTRLSNNRAMTFKKWMQSKGFPNIDDATTSTRRQSSRSNVDKGNNSAEKVKLWRSASMIITYNEYDVTEATETESTVTQGDNGALLNNVDKISNSTGSNGSDYWERIMQKTNDMMPKWALSNLHLSGTVGTEEDYWASQNTEQWTVNEPQNVPRYDNEGEFFEEVEKNQPFLRHLITDKIRYFDPAFHSISPEGFQARLTFLHQCTRQGATVENDNGAQSTAYNLAFGRPPVCVLRLGDFYYTKIIINSLSINYETPQWDLNPEGIGVMPMFANVSLSFTFLGGSDLAGPISRLQNAVSFNYYANTGVYDNRAEMVEYDPEGTGREIKFKPFSFPDMLTNNGKPYSGHTLS